MPRRTQPSIAVSADGRRWSLINASPDIREQLADFPGLHPRAGTRDLPLDSIVLTNADLDHVLGLLVLREALPYRVVSTPWVRQAVLDHNAAWRLLEPAWGMARLDEPIDLDREGRLEARLFPVPGKVPTYLRELTGYQPEATVGVRVTDTRSGRRLIYAPGLRSIDAGAWAELEAAECVFVDGTFCRADELAGTRPGAPDATAMGHVPIQGPGGSLERLAKHPGRRFYIHMNNTNPVLDAGSPEHATVRGQGVEIAMDGMEFEL
jgi:pyrroloquinoline quinone biosynthesis protein B